MKLIVLDRLTKGDLNMQCIYLNKNGQTQECLTGVANYGTTENDRQKYCETNNFLQCPRLIATLKAKEADGTITTSIQKK
jgi:hypothetical protein